MGRKRANRAQQRERSGRDEDKDECVLDERLPLLVGPQKVGGTQKELGDQVCSPVFDTLRLLTNAGLVVVKPQEGWVWAVRSSLPLTRLYA